MDIKEFTNVDMDMYSMGEEFRNYGSNLVYHLNSQIKTTNIYRDLRCIIDHLSLDLIDLIDMVIRRGFCEY